MKNICVYGVGGVGGFFGGKIANKINKDQNQDYKIYFIARGKHLEEIREKGLILNTPEEKGLICRPQMATENVEELPDIDIFLICVKSYDLEAVCRSIADKVKKDTIIIPLLNGVNIYQRMRKVITNGIIIPACVYVGTSIEKPGTVTQAGGNTIIMMGKDSKNSSFIPLELIKLFDTMNINYKWMEDVYPAIWEKYIFIAAFGLITAYSGKTLGQIMEDSILKKNVYDIMNEIVKVSEFEGIELRDNIVDETIQKAYNFPYETKTSYQRDFEQKGKQNEGDLFALTILELAEKYNIPVPVTREVWGKLQ